MSHNVAVWNKQYIKNMIAQPETAISYLGGAFNWSTTPQGDQYWGQRSTGNIPLDEEDIAFLKLLTGIKEDPFLLDPENKEFC